MNMSESQKSNNCPLFDPFFAGTIVCNALKGGKTVFTAFIFHCEKRTLSIHPVVKIYIIKRLQMYRINQKI